MKKNIQELSTGRKVEIREMSIDEIDECNDVAYIITQGEENIVRNLSKARTSWIRYGLGGGDFKNFKLNDNKQVSDSVVRQLSEVEKSELAVVIQGTQYVGEEKPSH